ncbi:MAG: hypothetical protein GY940_14050 [bacterium]|nr:hypothetical protein [bacterium]
MLLVGQSLEPVQKDGFSISIPSGWTEIPRHILDQFEEGLARLTPKAPKQHYDYGFQMDGQGNWFKYPYILIQIKNVGRIPQRELEKLDGYSFKDDLDEHNEELSPVMSDIQVGKMVYDKQSKMIWLRFESTVAGIGPISGISGMVLTEKGMIQVNGYSLRADFPTDSKLFRTIAMSVKPDPELVHNSNSPDGSGSGGIDWGRVGTKALIGGIIGGLVGLIIAGFRRRKKKE